MNKKQFVEKWGIDDTSVYPYKKRFPEIFQNETIDYLKLDEIIQERIDVKEKVKKIMMEKKPKDIEFVFSGNNAKPMSHNFVNQLFQQKEQILVRDSNYKKYLQIIEHFGETNGRS